MDHGELVNKERFCNACGLPVGNSFQHVAFYILPTKLVRKRHKETEREAAYCGACYDTFERLPYFVNGQDCSLPKVQRNKVGEMVCPICIEKLDDALSGLYGLVTATLWIDGSIIECWPLAFVCGGCVETNRIELTKEGN